jgi:LmbE family N-acetylglucosaminyl deacetylase
MEWIYFSPHFDDVAFSCGALVWEQAAAGQSVSVWTVCAGDQPPGPLSPFAENLHKRWEMAEDAVSLRRREDIQSCSQMRAAYRHFSIPDCIYRGSSEAFYNSEEALFGPIHPDEASLIQHLSGEIRRLIPLQAEVVCPLAIGGHVDHQLTRATAETLGRRLWYYADVPYVLDHMEILTELEREGWLFKRFPVSEAGLCAWEAAIAAHGSQISTFWKDTEQMRAAIEAYSISQGGIRLWQSPL